MPVDIGNTNTYVEVQHPHVAWVNGHAINDTFFSLSMGTFESFLSRYKVRGQYPKYTIYAHLNKEEAQALYDRLGKFLKEGE